MPLGFIVLSLGALVKNPYVLISALVAGYVAKFFVHGLVMFVAAIFNIVHVYVFTMLFMVSGLVRERKRSALAWFNPVLLLGLRWCC